MTEWIFRTDHIARASRPIPSNIVQPVLDKTHKAFLPYVQNITDRVSKLLKKHNIYTIFTPGPKVRDLIRPVKDQLGLRREGVYEVPCGCGQVYIGETGRSVATRLTEHIRAIRLNQPSKSAIAEHSCDCRQAILFDETRLLASYRHFNCRKIREAIEIHKNKFNRDEGVRLSNVWKLALQKHKLAQFPHRPDADGEVSTTRSDQNGT